MIRKSKAIVVPSVSTSTATSSSENDNQSHHLDGLQGYQEAVETCTPGYFDHNQLRPHLGFTTYEDPNAIFNHPTFLSQASPDVMIWDQSFDENSSIDFDLLAQGEKEEEGATSELYLFEFPSLDLPPLFN